jgi:hypothetical protein
MGDVKGLYARGSTGTGRNHTGTGGVRSDSGRYAGTGTPEEFDEPILKVIAGWNDAV